MSKEIKEFIESTLEVCDDITYSINEEKMNMASVMDLITLVANLSKNLSEMQNPDIDIEELNEKLNNLLSALEEGDMDLFSDNLQYELKPLLEYWKDVI